MTIYIVMQEIQDDPSIPLRAFHSEKEALAYMDELNPFLHYSIEQCHLEPPQEKAHEDEFTPI